MTHIVCYDSMCDKVEKSTNAKIDSGGFVKIKNKKYSDGTGIHLTRLNLQKDCDYYIFCCGMLPSHRGFDISINVSPTQNDYHITFKPKCATKYSEFLDVLKELVTDSILWTHEL